MRDVLFGLALTPSVGWKTIQSLIVQGVNDECLQYDKLAWKDAFPFLNFNQSEQLAKSVKKDVILEKKLDLHRKQIEFITIGDDFYPPQLKQIDSPPWVLFYRGDISLAQKASLSIVGSRKVTPYGKSVTRKLIPELIGYGWAIVSGMALGIDTLAHEETLKFEGDTVAVLGSGIDVIYPPKNRSLYERLTDKGLILSEYPPGTEAHPGFFPQRNRIIAGLSHGLIVVQAAKKSGSLISAHYALEYGREVFAIPGNIFEQQSVGTNVLIQQHGAKLVTSHHDILNEFSHLNIVPTEKKMEKYKTKLNTNDIENKILDILSDSKKHINELHELSSLTFSELSKSLLQLEMKQLIESLPGGFYERKQFSQLEKLDGNV